jgi:1-acyl-sn-glycerol-3-phosphate acyltransferase
MSVLPPAQNVFAAAPLITRAAFEIARGTRTTLHPLAAGAHQILYPQPQILGAEKIPADNPFLLIFNHYSTARLAAWWGPLVALDVIASRRTRAPHELQFVMAQEWMYATRFGRAVKQPLTKWLFARIARVYGIVTVAPVADGGYTRGQAVVGVRRALELTRTEPPALLALAPEGQSGPNAALCEPPPGAGIFLLLLTREQIPLLPLSIYETNNALTLRFGEPFILRDPRATTRAERDRAAAARVMGALADLLPDAMRGQYNA